MPNTVKFIELNWSPFATNPIDYIPGNEHASVKLETESGMPVSIFKSGNDFQVMIDGQSHDTGDNLSTCYFLNQYQVGMAK